MFLVGTSCEFLQSIFENAKYCLIENETTSFIAWLIPAFFAIKDQQDACRKLCILGEYYKHHFHEWSLATRAYKLHFLLLPALHLLNYQPSKEPSIDPLHLRNLRKSLLSWIPPEFDDLEVFCDLLPPEKQFNRLLNFPPYLPCSIENLCEFIHDVQKSVNFS